MGLPFTYHNPMYFRKADNAYRHAPQSAPEAQVLFPPVVSKVAKVPVMLKLESTFLTSAKCKVFKFPRNFQFKILCDWTAEAIQIHNYLPCNAWSTLTASSCTA
jgi:hypothetical protein